MCARSSSGQAHTSATQTHPLSCLLSLPCRYRSLAGACARAIRLDLLLLAAHHMGALAAASHVAEPDDVRQVRFAWLVDLKPHLRGQITLACDHTSVLTAVPSTCRSTPLPARSAAPRDERRRSLAPTCQTERRRMCSAASRRQVRLQRARL